MKITHEFVDLIPDRLKERTLYISIQYSTAVHNCFCGCRSEVVTPISPGDWRYTFDGESISLYPSIGNWSLPCKSHYWIEKSMVRWAETWSNERINLGREINQKSNKGYVEVRDRTKVEKLITGIMKLFS